MKPRLFFVVGATLAIALVASEGHGKGRSGKPRSTASLTKTAAPSKAAAPASSADTPVDDPSATPSVPAYEWATDNRTRNKPSPYHTERGSKDADKKITGCAVYEMNLFQDATTAGWGPTYLEGNAGGGSVTILPTCKIPKPSGGSFPALLTWLKKNVDDQVPGDVFVIRSQETWWNATSDQRVTRGLTYLQYTKSASFTINRCGTTVESNITCEAQGSSAARAINVVSYRLGEAKKLKTANNNAGCQTAALEAAATARGFAKTQVGLDSDKKYKTRFDGTLSDKALVAKVAAMRKDAEAMYTSCGGATSITTTEDDEQAYHNYW